MEEITSAFSSTFSFPPLIEGVGNEVLVVLPFLLLLVPSLLHLLLRQTAFLGVGAGDGDVPAANAENPTPDQLREQFLAERRTNNMPHYQDRQCPICLGESRAAVETNCGHLFCGECLSTYWTTQHPARLTPMLCPCCRQTVSVLFPQFTPAETAAERATTNVNNDDDDDNDNADAETPRSVTELINSYNRRFSGLPRPWMDYVYDLPVILRHLGSELFTLGGLATLFRLRVFCLVVAAILYVVSPLDIIPEAVFGILGFLDDFFFVFILVIYLSIQYRRVLAARGHAD